MPCLLIVRHSKFLQLLHGQKKGQDDLQWADSLGMHALAMFLVAQLVSSAPKSQVALPILLVAFIAKTSWKWMRLPRTCLRRETEGTHTSKCTWRWPTYGALFSLYSLDRDFCLCSSVEIFTGWIASLIQSIAHHEIHKKVCFCV